MSYTQPVVTATFAELQALVRGRLESVPYWTDTDIQQAINDALRLWSWLTSYWRKRVNVATSSSTPLVVVPGTLAQSTAITWAREPLVGVALAELALLAPDWWYARMGTARHPSRPLFWAPVGLSLLALYPGADAVYQLEVDGVRETPVLFNGGDAIDIGPEELDTLLGYVVHSLALKPGSALLTRTLPGLEAFVRAAATRNPLIRQTRWYSTVVKEGYPWPQTANLAEPGSSGPNTSRQDGAEDAAGAARVARVARVAEGGR